tara:strand:+ start:176 stop:484 length:309 start_codon:yes stop_codon:yes gene_type:complete
MFKIYISIVLLFILSNCAAPTASLFGPMITGAKTGSIYQASLSYGSNKIFHDFKKSNNRKNNEISKSIPVLESAIIEMPKILSTFTIAKVEYSDLIEPEPLP